MSATGSPTPCPPPERLLWLRHELLDDEPEAARLRAHLEGCDACAGLDATLEAALAPAPEPAPPEDVLAALEARIAADAARDAGQLALRERIGLRCTYCHDQLRAAEAVYCAACLAPQHEECFREPGRCAAPGCDGREVLRRQPARPASLPARRLRPRELLLLVGGLGAVLATAALLPERPRTVTPSVVLPGAPPSGRREALEVLARHVQGLEARLNQCDEALAIDPGCGPALLARAHVRWALARRDALESEAPDWTALIAPALADADQALRLEPYAAAGLLLRAELLLVRSDLEAALRSLARASELEPDSAAGLLARGRELELRQRWAEALAGYDRALERDPAQVPALLGRARVRLRRGEFQPALTDAQVALRHDPASAEALTLEAEARYEATGRADQAGPLQDLDAALQLDPSHGRALGLRAFVRLARDTSGALTAPASDRQAAERDARAALRVDPQEWRAELVLAELAAAQGEPEAERRASLAVERGQHPEAYLFRALLRFRQGDEDAAESDLGQAGRLTAEGIGPGRLRARVLTIQADAQLSRRELSAARVKLEESLRLDPGQVPARVLLGLVRYLDYEALHQGADLTMARAHFEEALQLDPRQGDALGYRALIRIEQGDLEGALLDLDRVEALGPARCRRFGYRQLDFYRGLVMMRRGDLRRARSLLQRHLTTASPGDRSYPQAKAWVDQLTRQLGERPDDPPVPPPPPIPSGSAGAFAAELEVELRDGVERPGQAGGARFTLRGRVPQLPDGARVRVSLELLPAPAEPLRAAFLKLTLREGAFEGQHEWPDRRLPPGTYRAQLLLALDDQPAAVRAQLARELGWPAGHVETLHETRRELGTPDERKAVRGDALGELQLLARGATVCCRDLRRGPVDPARGHEQTRGVLRNAQARAQALADAWVVLPEGPLLQRLNQALATLSRCARDGPPAGEDPLEAVAADLARLLDELQAGLDALYGAPEDR